jgi:hypothetical protein
MERRAPLIIAGHGVRAVFEEDGRQVRAVRRERDERDFVGA